MSVVVRPTPAREGRGGERVGRQRVGNQRLAVDKVGEEFGVEAVCSPCPLCAAATLRPLAIVRGSGPVPRQTSVVQAL